MLLNLRNYHRPESIEEAIDLLWGGAPGTVALAGGTTLVASGRRDVEAVVDLRALDLSYVRVQGATLHIGATTTLQSLVDNPDLQSFSSGLLAQTAGAVAGRNVRNGATVGGRIASGGGDDPLLTALLALGARLTLYAPKSRQVPLISFLAYRARLLRDGALIARVSLPLLIGPLGAAYAAVGRTPRDRPIVCAVARLELAAGIGANVRLAVGGVAPTAVRANSAEGRLERKRLTDERVAEAVETWADELSPEGDFRGTGEYRREMARVLARRALLEAAARARAIEQARRVAAEETHEDQSDS